mmetsp:Transcript_4449/g.7410  ORF Transcript_4449/g.7410 Transcript_4449/m.7410 type:complete len:109 (-) Transcript_4449:413-739(-)|eukprot:CAMPEP_0119107842 /NCGR_PEP_ID=MMETSP1180-20130426/11834_1 /TAXON_ID=3052 ORGANISM="Chlamydomonas cf sp, Strain CCMP681" /NCGR_SAMPLE_ID=MMETSP1180 /ASSEMBLY_ACC=CAM_ASM_000741 /LENGTH=108 /DNA_ID=CAMNT_0007093387 /DNA_START=193 /DNA_END=519 /DNA_ORIENTATION=+
MSNKQRVEKALAADRVLEAATAHAADLRTATNVTAWHQRDSQRLAATPKSGSTTIRSHAPGGDQPSYDVEAVVKAARRSRLKELYMQEAAMYEAELAERGLALVKVYD